MATVPTPTTFYPNQGPAADNYLKHKQPGSYPNEGSRRWGRAPAAPTGGVPIDPRGTPEPTDEPEWTRQELIDWINNYIGVDLPAEFYDDFSDHELFVLVELLTNEDEGPEAALSSEPVPDVKWTKRDIATWLKSRGVDVGKISRTTKNKMLKQVELLTKDVQ